MMAPVSAPVPAWKVPLADLNYDEAEEKAVLDVLRSRWLTMGSVTQAFENEFAALLKTRHALAVSNATVALHLACLAVGVGPGDEVIVPSLSFVATANAVLYAGAEVRFADILGPHDLTIDPASVASQITPRTKAIIVMHYGGYPCQMPAILEIARAHGLAVIEDAAHSPGAWLDRRHLGTLGDIGCFSFFSNKNLSTGEGGMLVTDRPELADKLRLMRSHGMTSLTWDRHQGHAYSYDVVELGYNYRIDEIHSALGREQLRKLEAGNAHALLLAGARAGQWIMEPGSRAAVPGEFWKSCHPARSPHLPAPAPGKGRSQGVHRPPARGRHPDQHPLPAHPQIFVLPTAVRR